MLTSLVEKYDIYFEVQAKRCSVHVNGYCGTELKVKNTLMTGAINYVRREGRYVMKYYLVAVISIWRSPSDFLQ